MIKTKHEARVKTDASSEPATDRDQAQVIAGRIADERQGPIARVGGGRSGKRHPGARTAALAGDARTCAGGKIRREGPGICRRLKARAQRRADRAAGKSGRLADLRAIGKANIVAAGVCAALDHCTCRKARGLGHCTQKGCRGYSRVRRQSFWLQKRLGLSEHPAHLVGFIMRRTCGDASAGFLVFCV